MLTAGGYPGDYRKGDPIRWTSRRAESLYLHAGTKALDSGEPVTNGGRVMAITSFGNNIAEAVGGSLDAAAAVEFEGKYYRKDIGKDLL